MNKFLEDHPLVKTLSGVLFLVIGLILLAFVVVNLARDASIWVLGRRVTAEVVDLWVEQTGENEEEELTFRYFVRYQFTTSDDQVITGTSSVWVNEWAFMREGSPVAVVYFPLYPAHNRLDESRLVPILACAYLPFALLSWAGLVVGWNLIRPALASLKGQSIPETLRQDASDDAPS